jgi:hypothetical protein
VRLCVESLCCCCCCCCRPRCFGFVVSYVAADSLCASVSFCLSLKSQISNRQLTNQHHVRSRPCPHEESNNRAILSARTTLVMVHLHTQVATHRRHATRPILFTAREETKMVGRNQRKLSAFKNEHMLGQRRQHLSAFKNEHVVVRHEQQLSASKDEPVERYVHTSSKASPLTSNEGAIPAHLLMLTCNVTYEQSQASHPPSSYPQQLPSMSPIQLKFIYT